MRSRTNNNKSGKHNNSRIIPLKEIYQADRRQVLKCILIATLIIIIDRYHHKVKDL